MQSKVNINLQALVRALQQLSVLECAYMEPDSFFIGYYKFWIAGNFLFTDCKKFHIDNITGILNVLAYKDLIPRNRLFIKSVIFNYKKITNES